MIKTILYETAIMFAWSFPGGLWIVMFAKFALRRSVSFPQGFWAFFYGSIFGYVGILINDFLVGLTMSERLGDIARLVRFLPGFLFSVLAVHIVLEDREGKPFSFLSSAAIIGSLMVVLALLSFTLSYLALA
ncbi:MULTISPECIES: hypothetical protein [Mameliella]|uniref:Uncharacterized protein n=1 Tax=Mameliella alba TaxID=561184 RepID=A0A0B3SKL5_9RHOB|nr:MULTISPECIES: hypothetical protein [Mameliella]KHQ51094.1 hypothetical protein OA50_04465 [Mameliella alba]